MNLKNAWFYVICFLFCLGIFALGYSFPRSSFYTNFFIYSALFVFYGYLYIKADTGRLIKQLLLLGVMVRLLLLVSLPPWSDDYVRFIWDGHQMYQGHSPYSNKPSEVLETRSDFFLEQLFPLLNSPDYYSVYPPSNQLLFAMAVWLAGENLLVAVMVMRLFLLAFEILTFYLIIQLLRNLGLPSKKVLLYALNPLVIMEIVGNLHFEGMMLSFILVGFLLLIQSMYTLSGLALGAAVAIKLSPLILVPAFFQYLSKRAFVRFFFGGLLLIVLGFYPVFGKNYYSGFFESLSLYVDSFEFNASVYYIIRQLGFWIEGYNVIGYWGPILKIVALSMILFITFRQKIQDHHSFLNTIMLIYWMFFLFSTVVHPWYIIPAFGLSLFTKQNSFLIWTYLIFLSYHAYQQEPYQENIWVLLLEYIMLYMAIWADHKGWWCKILSKEKFWGLMNFSVSSPRS